MDCKLGEGDYERRFPSKMDGGGTGSMVCGRFSMEDLNRATLCFYQLLVRRDKKRSLFNCALPESKGSEFPGYADSHYKANEVKASGIDLAVNTHCQTQLAFEAEANRVKADRAAR